MGSHNSILTTAHKYGIYQFNDSHWSKSYGLIKQHSLGKLQSLPIDSRESDTFMNIFNHNYVDKYIISDHENNNVQDYFSHMNWRNKCEHLVHCKFVKCSEDQLLCQNKCEIAVYLEHVQFRLLQITDFPFPENLGVLKSCLQGYKYIFQRYKHFQVRQDLICINEQGKIKVWIHSNLAKDFPQIKNAYRSNKGIEIKIVSEIINLITENTDHQFQPKQFKTFLRDNNLVNLNFEQALEALYQFAQLLKITIPQQLNSICDLLNSSCQNMDINLITEQSQSVVEEQTNKKEQLSFQFNQMNNLSKTIKVQPNYIQPQIHFTNNPTSMNNTIYIPRVVSQPTTFIPIQFNNPASTSIHFRTVSNYSRPSTKVQFTHYEQPPLKFQPTFTNKLVVIQKQQQIKINNNIAPKHQQNNEVEVKQSKQTVQQFVGKQQPIWSYFGSSTEWQIDPEIAKDLNQMN